MKEKEVLEEMSFMGQDLYSFVHDYTASCFAMQEVLKESADASICKLLHKDSGRPYILRKMNGSTSAFKTYQTLLHCRCDNLPVIYEAASQGERWIVLEEFVVGDTLDALLQAGPFSRSETKKIALQVCNALQILHSFGLVHRDVKPENLILTGNRAVLIDFGAAREISSSRQKDTKILGTVGYAAPEQYGLSQTDSRADIYAMGILINEMLTLRHPSVLLAPGRWGRIVGKCTMVSPEKRYQSIEELYAALKGPTP